MKFGLSDGDLAKINSVFARFPQIEQVVLYGSRAKGNYRAGSDIDLTLFGPDTNDLLLSQILSELDDLNTPYLMDVSLYDQIVSSELKKHIAEYGQLFYKK